MHRETGVTGASSVHRRGFLAGAGAVLASPWLARRAAAQDTAKEIRIGLGNGLAYLPFYVGLKRNLFAESLAAAGLPDVTLSVAKLANVSAMNEGMLSGAVDLTVMGSPGLLIVWAKTRGHANQVMGCAGVTTLPLSLVTVTDRIKSLADFTPADRIAVPSIIGTPATVLRMACEEAFGRGQQGRLDANLVSLPHPEALSLLLRGSEITGYEGSPPFTNLVLKDPRGRVVVRSEDVFKGKASFVLLCARRAYAEQNPRALSALIAALDKANASIASDPKGAAAIYVSYEPSKIINAELVESILRDPTSVYTTVPHGVMRFAEFMGRTGELKTVPKSWKDVFVAQAQNLPGD